MSQEKAAEAEIIALNLPHRGDAGPRAIDTASNRIGDLASVEGANAGARLAATRRAAGLSHSEVSDATKIKIAHLAAIEASDRDALPAIPFTLGFVKTYAKYLGLDGDELTQQFRADIGADAPVVEEEPEKAPLITPSFTSDGARIVSLLGVAAVLIFAIWITIQIVGPRDREGATQRADSPRVTLGAAPAAAVEANTVNETTDHTVTDETTDDSTDVATDDAVETSPAQAPQTQVDTTVAAPVAEAPAVVEAPSADEPAPVAETPPAADTSTFAEAAPLEENAPPVEEAPIAQDEAAAAEEGLSPAQPEAESPVREAAIESPVEPGVESSEDTANAAVINIPQSAEETETSAPADFIEPQIEIVGAEPEPVSVPAPQIVAQAPAPEQTRPQLQRGEPARAEDFVVDAGPTRTPAPRYPSRCDRDAQDVESVVVVFDVNANGRTANARVAETSNACFNSAAIATIGRWRFSPRTVNGQPRPETGKRATVRFAQ